MQPHREIAFLSASKSERGVADLHKGQVAQEEVHGGTKTSAAHDSEHDEEIPQHNCYVQKQK